MPKKIAQAVETAESIPVVTSEVLEEVEAKAFHVYDKHDQFVRTYLPTIHGPEAGKLAKQYADKIKGTVR